MKITGKILCLIFISILPHTNAHAQWKVGDKVEAYDQYKNKWENATITVVHDDWNPVRYKATLDDPAGHSITELLLQANEIRSKDAQGNKIATNNNSNSKNFSVGSRVDVYYTGGEPKARATVIENKGNGRFKVHYDGCKAYRDEEVDWSQLKPQSIVSANDPDITATFGKWAMFVYSYPNTVIHGNDIYRQYGTGAKAPPLQINANGTYIWYDEFNKPPVKGNWETHAKITGMTMGTEKVNGIILKDSYGNLWKIYKDRVDHVEARKMCTGETQGGTKIK